MRSSPFLSAASFLVGPWGEPPFPGMFRTRHRRAKGQQTLCLPLTRLLFERDSPTRAVTPGIAILYRTPPRRAALRSRMVSRTLVSAPSRNSNSKQDELTCCNLSSLHIAARNGCPLSDDRLHVFFGAAGNRGIQDRNCF